MILRWKQLKRQHSSERVASNSDTDSVSKPVSGDKPVKPSDISTTPPNAPASIAGAPDAAKPAVSALNGEYFGSPLKKQRGDEPGSGEDSLQSRLGPEVSSSVSEILGSGTGGEPKDSSTASSCFGDSLKPKEPESAHQEMEEEEL